MYGNVHEVGPEDFQLKARRLVQEQHNETGIGTRRGDVIIPLELDEIYIVWFSKTLQNWKALVATSRPDARYYEITYDGDKRRAYVDTYLKTHNITVPD